MSAYSRDDRALASDNPDPALAECELIARYAERDGLPVKAGNVIFERRPWFDLLHAQGVLDGWLASEADDLNRALGFLRSVAPLAPKQLRS
ncbi:MAG: hypothetical protein QHC40_00415 [Sphingobium sp.]|nr:hypothetical protein [Sphingobium sp.]